MRFEFYDPNKVNVSSTEKNKWSYYRSRKMRIVSNSSRKLCSNYLSSFVNEIVIENIENTINIGKLVIAYVNGGYSIVFNIKRYSLSYYSNYRC